MEQPAIDVVIIGINVEKYLPDCIRHVQSVNYQEEKINLIYADGGSTDASIEIARRAGAEVVALNDIHPSPGRGRNAGYRQGKAPVVQFLDADTYVDPEWFNQAVPRLNGDVGAVHGVLREREPDRNRYHEIANLEWGVIRAKSGWAIQEGPTTIFGGNVLIRREAIEQTTGYDESLVAGEDPDFSFRVRQDGWQLLRLTAPMATHDINMDSFSRYWKRASRSGHAYAQIGVRYSGNREKLFMRQLVRIVAGVSAPIVFAAAGMFSGFPLLGFTLAALIILRPALKFRQYQRDFQIPAGTAVLYALHLAFAVYPQFFGVLRYFYGVISNKPLRNTGPVATRQAPEFPQPCKIKKAS